MMYAGIAGDRMLRFVPFNQQLAPLIFSQKLYLRHALIGISDDLFEKSLVVREETFAGRFIKEVSTVEEKALKPTIHVPDVAFEIESGCQGLKLLRSERQAGELKLLHG